MRLEDLLDLVILADIAEPPVQLGNEDDVHFVALDGLQQGQHGRPILHILAGGVSGIGEHTDDAHSVCPGVLFQVTLLVMDRQAVLRLFFSGHAGV